MKELIELRKEILDSKYIVYNNNYEIISSLFDKIKTKVDILEQTLDKIYLESKSTKNIIDENR